MPRYLIKRTIGELTDEQLEHAARNAKKVREEEFPDVTWEHTHVVHEGSGLATFCIYAAPGEARVREHAAASGLPVDEIYELKIDVDPEML